MGEAALSTAQKGELALLRAWQRAAEKGWITSRPIRDCRYDLVLDDGQRLYRVQVKFGAELFHNRRGISIRYAPTQERTAEGHPTGQRYRLVTGHEGSSRQPLHAGDN